MKKFWIVLLSLGLIMALTMPVLAADVKFSGEFKVQGIYNDNSNLGQVAGQTNQGLSLTWQRLRVGTEFKVAEGLSLTTRFDAMERVWGAPRTTTAAGAAQATDTPGVSTAGALRDAESQNIRFEQAFMTFNVPCGVFRVGYQTQGKFGTEFGNNGEIYNGPRARYDFATGPLNFAVIWEKMDGAKNIVEPKAMDQDYEKYHAFGIYKWSTGEGGLLLTYVNNTGTGPIVPNRTQLYSATPYVKATFGPVYVEAEANYVWGKLRTQGGDSIATDIDKSGYYGYLLAKADFAPVYVGAAAFYVSGDDKTDASKSKTGLGTGADFNPCLILLNYDLYRLGTFGGAATAYGNNTSDGSGMNNVYGYQIFAGVKPIPKLDVKLSWTMAGFNETSALANGTSDPKTGQSKDLGSEFDLTATYKIYDNLSYMVGAAYWLVGDFAKGGNAAVTVKNDYLLTHMLTLTF